ncbi:MAG: pantoate--beta-alanine ligase [Nocardioides sp.]|uniref:pantoate--beta-alanine ligase n=1 Tax=Nocardioides sp. TaxID=35761 RepID=UPI0039E5F825
MTDRAGRPAVAATRAELAGLLSGWRGRGGTGQRQVALVPTMGALHEGHGSLIRLARERVGDGAVVVSIFVNPMQFGAGEDFDRYPRTLADDLAVCAREGVDVVFAPDLAEVYPGGEPQVRIDPGPRADTLEGRARPGHFAGVLTVVAKLFGLVRPDVAVFGEKDYQQLALVTQLATDLCLGVEVVGAPTRRERDGLALSSRNRYLDPEQRAAATALSRALYAAQAEARYGVDAALEEARAELRTAHGVDLDYLVITDPALGELPDVVPPGTPARILIAARLGDTRLIDNMALVIG